MCVIIVGRGETVPSRSTLERACACNPDGFGWALVVEHDGVRDLVSGRSMLARDAIQDFKHAVRDHKGDILASLFHARIATHGAISLALCHPFEIPGSRAVLAHNGILPVSTHGSPLSDSAIFAREYLPALGGPNALRDPYVAHVVGEFATGSKLVVLDPDATDPVIFINEDRGFWEKDLWYSNESALPPTSVRRWKGFGYGDYEGGDYLDDLATARSKYQTFNAPATLPTTGTAQAMSDALATFARATDPDDDETTTDLDFKCGFCGSYVDGDDARYGYCPYCDACRLCGDDWAHCECTASQIEGAARATR